MTKENAEPKIEDSKHTVNKLCSLDQIPVSSDEVQYKKKNLKDKFLLTWELLKPQR